MRVNKLSGIVMRVTAVLICLVLFSAHLASGMFAKYTSKVEEQSDARVAKFNVSVKETAPLSFDESGIGTYQFYVYNQDSEVAFQCDDIIVRFNAVDNSGLFSASELTNACTEAKLNGNAGTYSASTNSYTFSVADRVERGSQSGVYTLTFKKSDLVKINEEATEPITETDISIDLDVSAKGAQAI